MGVAKIYGQTSLEFGTWNLEFDRERSEQKSKIII